MCVFKRTVLAASATMAVMLVGAPPAGASFVTIEPSSDNTMFEDNTNRSCGIGPLFGGETGHAGSRRVLVAFDVAGNVPAGSTVTSVELQVTVESSGPSALDSDVFELHRLLADWGEKGSICTIGVGALAEPDDATWSHRHYPTDPWIAPGGDFNATASGSAAIATVGPAAWTSQPGMIADVQSWLDNPGSNFGWVVIGDETAPYTAREFESRESDPPSSRPSLRVEFTPPPTPPPAVPDGTTGSPVMLSKISPDGADLGVAWDVALCNGNVDHHIVFGTGSGLPSTLGGSYAIGGGVCHLGASSPFVWSGSPDPAALDPSTRLLWMVVVADDGLTTEGSWGRASLLYERNGPGLDGCSNQCGIVDKNLSNACGN